MALTVIRINIITCTVYAYRLFLHMLKDLNQISIFKCMSVVDVVAIVKNQKSRLILVNQRKEVLHQRVCLVYRSIYISISICYFSLCLSIKDGLYIYICGNLCICLHVFYPSILLHIFLSKVSIYLSINLSTLMISSKVIYLFSEDGSPEILTDKLQ